MPVARALVRAPLAVIAALPRLARAIAFAVVFAIGVFAALLLVIRLVVFPNIDRYRDDITRAIGAELKQPVSVDALQTGWNGWNPKLLISGFRIGDPRASGGGAALELPRVELTIAWTSLATAELRLKQLVIDAPRLAVRRDAAGMLHVAGVEIDPDQPHEDTSLSDWLLRQREIVVRDALITWTDERRNAPQLVLDHVNFRLEGGFGRRRFGLTGTPPAELAAPIDVRGSVTGASLRDWRNADGQLYARLDYADVAAWREWLPLPVDIDAGKGAVRAWFTFAQGQVREVVADLELADVRTRLQPDLPELALAHVSGRAGWRYTGSTREVFLRALGFRTAEGLELEPTDLTVTLTRETDGAAAGGRVAVDRLELEPVRALAQQLPLPEEWRTELKGLALKGGVARAELQWEGSVEAPTAYRATASLVRVSAAAHGPWPGVANVTGTLNASRGRGDLTLDSRAAALEVPGVFAAPVPLDTLQGNVSWSVAEGRTTVTVRDLVFANADAAGKLRAVYRSAANGPGDVDLDATLSRASAAAVPRYVPTFMSEGFRGWIAQAIKPGVIDEASMRVKGDLALFPFADERQGTFSVDVKGRNFGLEYATGWPAFTAVDAEVHFRGPGLRIIATRGRMFGVQFASTTASIADLRAPVLQLDASASGPTADFLRFITETPVNEETGRFAEAARVAGDGKLALKLVLPLRDLDARRVTGEYALVGNQVALAGVPPLAQVNGAIAFTERDLRGRDITAQALGGPVRIAVATADGHTRVTASGSADVQAVGREFEVPFGDRVSGAADWTFALDARGDITNWNVQSPLKGVAIDLPEPLRKSAGDALPMHLERVPVRNGGEDMLVGTLGEVAQFTAHRRFDGPAAKVDRAVIALGRAPRLPDARNVGPGLWLRAGLAEFDVDEWLAVQQRAPGTPVSMDADLLRLAGVDIKADELTAFGRRFSALAVNGRRTGEDWRLELDGKEVSGTATWSAPTAAAPNGVVLARLARFTPPAAADPHPSAPEAEHGAMHWPALDIAAERFSSTGRELGRLELAARPRPGEWRIDRLLLANESGRIEANGAWTAGARPDRTELEVRVDVQEAGAFLAHFGYPGTVTGAPTRITGQLAWSGDPSDFDYPTLSGAFHLDVGSGRFLKVEPGFGKLLGVLSLQALPRRITLDFRDVFSEGLTFDRVTGDVRIARGVMTTDNFQLVGPSAQIAIAGEADLAQETQHLKVRVQPTLSASVSAGAALLFLANPVVGAAVGAGSLLAQKMLRDPIEQIFSHAYDVTGSWSDPQVARAVTAAAGVPSEPTKSP